MSVAWKSTTVAASAGQAEHGLRCPWQEAGAASGRAAATASGAAAAVEAADAADALAALEALLPESVGDLMGLVHAHAAAPGSRFAARQLLLLAGACADLADASGRRAAGELLQVGVFWGPTSCIEPFALCSGCVHVQTRWDRSATTAFAAGRRMRRPCRLMRAPCKRRCCRSSSVV